MSAGFRVSVVIPSFNRAAALPHAIDSALAQSCPATEVLVVDDGSTDDTADVLARYATEPEGPARVSLPPVRRLVQPNAGAAAARNRGIHAATGNWIAFLDSDDVWLPHKLERQLDTLRRFPHLRWCACGYQTMGVGGVEASALPARLARELDRVGYLSDYFDAAGRGLVFPTPGMLVETALLHELGGFDPRLSEAEDLDLWARVALLAPAIGYVREACYRVDAATPGSLSKAGRRTECLVASMVKLLAEAQERSPEAARRFQRYAHPRAFRLLLRAMAGREPVGQDALQQLWRHFPPSGLQARLLRLLSWMPAGLARRLGWRLRDGHQLWHSYVK